MVADSFVVYGGGRWRAVDAQSGSVAGWGRVQWAVARRGRLVLVRARRTLTALRALAAHRHSAAREGPLLEYRYPAELTNPVSRQPENNTSKLCCCYHHYDRGNNATNEKASVAVQCEATLPSLQLSSKRRRDSTSSERQFHTKVTSVAAVHIPRKLAKRGKTLISPDKKNHATHLPHANSNDIVLETKKPSKSTHTIGPMKRKNRRSSDTSLDEIVLETKKPSKRTHTIGPMKRKNRSPSDTSLDEIVLETEKPCKSSQTMGPTKRKKRKSSDTPKTEVKNNKYKYLQPPSKKLKRSDEPIRRRRRSIIRGNSSTESETAKRRAQHSQRKQSSSSDRSSERGTQKTSIESHKQGPKSKQRKHQIFDLIISSDSEAATKPSKEQYTRKIEENNATKTVTEKPSGECKARDPLNSRKKLQTQGSCTELVIDDRDVDILRLYLGNFLSDEELLRFDTDNNYKLTHFYRINPLVHIERCPHIARMLKSQEQMRLVDFASQLGLRSVSEASYAARRYRTRTRERKGGSTDSNTDKENSQIPAKRPTKHTLKSLRERNYEIREKTFSHKTDEDQYKDKTARHKNHDKNNEKYNNKYHNNLKDQRIDTIINTNVYKHKNRNVDTAEMSSDSEGDSDANKVQASKQKAEASKQKAEASKQKAGASKPSSKLPKVVAKPKRPALKEYSNLEDHAIVSWVTVGARASLVNGNRLWRELQEQYPRIVGHGRTWHSLRNRYLRYILPRLGGLALPHSLQARLRAAAATGELKGGKRGLAAGAGARRNSMFALPPRGAASRAPRPPPPTPDVTSKDNIKRTTKAPPSPRPPSPGRRRSTRIVPKSPSPRKSSSHPAPRVASPPPPPPARRSPTTSARRVTRQHTSPRRNSPIKSTSSARRSQTTSARRSPTTSARRVTGNSSITDEKRTSKPRSSRRARSSRSRSVASLRRLGGGGGDAGRRRTRSSDTSGSPRRAPRNTPSPRRRPPPRLKSRSSNKSTSTTRLRNASRKSYRVSSSAASSSEDAFPGSRGDPSGARGDPSGARGDPSGARGDPSGARGDPSGARGDPSGARGDPSGARRRRLYNPNAVLR